MGKTAFSREECKIGRHIPNAQDLCVSAISHSEEQMSGNMVYVHTHIYDTFYTYIAHTYKYIVYIYTHTCTKKHTHTCIHIATIDVRTGHEFERKKRVSNGGVWGVNGA